MLRFGAAGGWGSSLVTGVWVWLSGRGAREAVLDWVWGVWDTAGVTSRSVRERERENQQH